LFGRHALIYSTVCGIANKQFLSVKHLRNLHDLINVVLFHPLRQSAARVCGPPEVQTPHGHRHLRGAGPLAQCFNANPWIWAWSDQAMYKYWYFSLLQSSIIIRLFVSHSWHFFDRLAIFGAIWARKSVEIAELKRKK